MFDSMHPHRGLLALLAALYLTVAVPIGAAAEGDAASLLSSHELRNLQGESVRLSSMKGEVLVVNFWASWCKPCLKELPVMDEWHRSWKDRGARVVAISIDSDERRVRRFVQRAGLGLDVMLDGPDQLARALDLPHLPTTYLLDQRGRVLEVMGGSSEEQLAALHRRVESLLSASSSTRRPASLGDGVPPPMDAAVGGGGGER